MPSAKRRHGYTTTQGYLYAISGTDDTPAPTSSVFYGVVSATGSISQWFRGVSQPKGVYGMGSFADSGFIFTVGGYDDSNPATATTRYAPINSNNFGSPVEWGEGPVYPVGIFDFACSSWNGYGVCSGGNTGQGVYVTSLRSRNTYWGVEVPPGASGGNYTSTITMTAVFNP
jgi:hypothetical protein